MGKTIDTIVEGCKRTAMIFPETLLFFPYDLISVLLKNNLPHSWKEKHDSLACRYYKSDGAHCKHVKKYMNKLVFKMLVCPRNYNYETGQCKKTWHEGRKEYVRR